MSTIENQIVALCHELRRRREGLNLTLDELAKRSGLTASDIVSIESAEHDPSLSTIESVVRGLGLSMADLLQNMHGLSVAGHEAAWLFTLLPPYLQKAVLLVLKTGKKRRA